MSKVEEEKQRKIIWTSKKRRIVLIDVCGVKKYCVDSLVGYKNHFDEEPTYIWVCDGEINVTNSLVLRELLESIEQKEGK